MIRGPGRPHGQFAVDVDLAGKEADGLGEAADRVLVAPIDNGRISRIRHRHTQTVAASWAAACKAFASTPLIGRVSPVRTDHDSPNRASEVEFLFLTRSTT